MPQVTFNMVGPQGPQGDIGPTGDTGATGPKGDPGSLAIVTDGTNTDSTLPGTLQFGPGIIVTPDSPNAASVLVGLVYGTTANTVVDGASFSALFSAFSTHNSSTAQHGATGAVVGTTNAQTLTNKTLTSPTISGPTMSGTIGGTYTIGGTPTFPASVVTTTAAQTLTNKTLTSPIISSITNGAATLTLPTTTNTMVGRSTTDTLTNKTISGSSNTLTNLPGANVTGTVPIGSLPTGTTSTTLSTGDRGMPSGGSSQAYLRKNSATSYDVSWVARGAVTNNANSTSTTTQSSGTVDYVTTSLVLPNDGNYLVIVMGMYDAEGTGGTTGDFQLNPTIGANVLTYPTTRVEQGVDTCVSFSHSAVVAGNQTLTCKMTVQWIAGSIGPKCGQIVAIAIPV